MRAMAQWQPVERARRWRMGARGCGTWHMQETDLAQCKREKTAFVSLSIVGVLVGEDVGEPRVCITRVCAPGSRGSCADLQQSKKPMELAIAGFDSRRGLRVALCRPSQKTPTLCALCDKRGPFCTFGAPGKRVGVKDLYESVGRLCFGTAGCHISTFSSAASNWTARTAEHAISRTAESSR